MKIESVDVYYLAMPEVLDIGDGSQDALLVRVRGGGHEGWGECEAAPLPSIAAWMCPRSHSACKPVRDSVLGQTLRDAGDIRRIGDLVRADSLDLLQAEHTLSGVEIALWDLLGKKLQAPVWQLLGYPQALAQTPYASVLFGATPGATLAKGRQARAAGFTAVKFGWGPFGRGAAQADRDQLQAARQGLEEDGILLVDAGTVWVGDLQRAAQTLPYLLECRAAWLEEPFVSGALEQYAALAKLAGPSLKLAAGEGSHNVWMARHLIDYGGVGFIQIDAGRIGGIAPAHEVAQYAAARGVAYVNHTFTSHLALSASLQPAAGLREGALCEYPLELKPLAVELTCNHIERDGSGQVQAPAAPGLGMTINLETVRAYLVPLQISVRGQLLYDTPEV